MAGATHVAQPGISKCRRGRRPRAAGSAGTARKTACGAEIGPGRLLGWFAREESLHARQEALAPRRMLARIVLQRLFELAQQLALLAVEFHRRLDDHAAEQVAASPASYGRHTLVAQPEHASRLSLRRNLER